MEMLWKHDLEEYPALEDTAIQDGSAAKVWNTCLEYVAPKVKRQTFHTWFQPIRVVGLEDDTLVLEVANQFALDWIGEHFTKLLSRELGRRVAPHEILFDAPPIKLEVEFNIEVYDPKEACYRQLGDISPVVQTLARQQFDDFVKRVRLFAHPGLATDINPTHDINGLLREAIAMTNGADAR